MENDLRFLSLPSTMPIGQLIATFCIDRGPLQRMYVVQTQSPDSKLDMGSLHFAKKPSTSPRNQFFPPDPPRLPTSEAHARSCHINQIHQSQSPNLVIIVTIVIIVILSDEPSGRIEEKRELGLRNHASLLLKRPYRCTKCFIELPLAASLQGRRAGQGSWARGPRHGLIYNVTSPASPGKVRR